MALSATGSGASRSVVYKIIADIGGLRTQMAQASASVKKFGNDVTATSKEGDKLRKGFDNIGRTAGRVGLIAAAGLGIMVAKAAQFDQAMSHVEAATHETADNMAVLRTAAIKAGAATQFSATEAAGAIEELAKAGVSTADILKGGLSGALNLAAAGMVPVADAAQDIATALTQFKLPGEQATHVADLLAAGAGKAQGEVSDLAEALKFAGVPAANLGVSIDETAGALALFAKNGIIGSQAGTSLRGLLSSLTSPSKQAANTLDELGISLFNSKGNFIGLAGVADQLQSHLGDLTQQERAYALGRIFGNEQLQAANVLFREGGDAVRQWTRNVNDSGYAAETARIKMDNLKGDLEQLRGSLETALIKGGEGPQSGLRGLVQGATDAVNAFNGLPPTLANTASGMLAITAITGGGLWFGSKVVRGIADTREAMQNLNEASTVLGRGLKGLALAGAAFAGWAVITEVVKGIQSSIQETLPGLNTMQKRLIAISKTRDIADLGSQFDDLGTSIDRAFNKGKIDTAADAINKVVFFGGEATDLKEAKAEIDSLDQALAALVSSGHANLAASALSAIGQSSHLTGDQMADLRANLPAYQDALDGLSNQATLTAAAHVGMGKKVRIAGQAIHFTAAQIGDARKLYEKQRADAQNVAEGFLDISKKADRARVSLGKWITQMQEQAQALENFTANIKLASKRGLADGLIQQLEKLGPVGALRMKQLAHATDEEIGKANAAYRRGQKAIQDYVDATTTVPDELRTDVKVIDDPARRALRALKQQFAASPKSVTTQMKVDNRQAYAGINALEARFARLRRLAALQVTLTQHENRLGPGFATGGYISGPGTRTSDSIPAYLSNGEYVIKAAAVARYGVAMFDRLNAMRFAQGGPVSTPNRETVVVERGSQPLIGVQNVMPHNYSEFRRQQEQNERMAGSDGLRR